MILFSMQLNIKLIKENIIKIRNAYLYQGHLLVEFELKEKQVRIK